ncbi:hypothetical protein AX15_002887 [Amanita polypyramis BW_CC]|nr:hypothetical protein AX15_002887 [Amanita polypyramis BW_CC]
MSHYRSDSAVAGPSSDRDVPTSPSAQPTPASPTQGPSPIQGSSKDNALSEKYKKLKRRFFELEEETSTELQRSSERNVRMREERNMLLDRIIELEAQSQLQNEEGGSPTSPSFPRTLMSARAHDDVDPAPTSRHLDSQARRKSDDDRREEEAREAKKSTRRSRALNSSSPKGKEGDSDAVAVSPRLYSAHEEPCQISDPLPDVMDAQHECRATSGDPATLDTSLSTSPDSSVPPIQLEIQSQSPVQKPDVLLHVDSSNVDQQGSERPSDRTASSIDGSAVTDVVMADGTSRAANGHTVSPPADGTNAEVSFGPGIPVDDVTKTSSNQQREADSENMDVVPPEDGNEAIPQGKTRGKGATTRGTRGKKTKKLIRAEAECSQMSRRSARLARSTEVPSKSGVRTQQALDGNVKQPTHATRSQTPASIYARTLSPSHAFEDNISAASPPPPSDVPESGTLIESPSPSPTTNDLQGHILDVIDPLLKHSGIPSVSSPSLSSASASHQLDNTSIPSK